MGSLCLFKVQLKALSLSKLEQLALKIISLRVIRELIIVIKYVTKGSTLLLMHETLALRFCYLKCPLFLALNLERSDWYETSYLAGMSEWDRISIIHIFKLH